MSFINKKEEVIQIQLTQYGRSILSKGKFKPMYYSFYDDEIIYDSHCAGFSEDQNSTEARIKEAPRHRLVSSKVSSESKLKREGTTLNNNNEESFELQTDVEKELLVSSQLGHMKLSEQSSPHFVLNTTEDVITPGLGDANKGVVYDETLMSIKIPQVDVEILYETFEDREVKPDVEIFDSETFIDLLSEKIKFLDGTSLRLEKENLIFELIEENVPYEDNNFEIEVFEVENNPDNSQDSLVPIKKESELQELFSISKDESVSKEGLRLGSTVDRNFFTKE